MSTDSPDWIPAQVHEAIAAADAADTAATSATADTGSFKRQASAATYGKDGAAELELLANGPGYRYFRAPLSSGRILRSDPNNRATQVAYLRSTGGGLAQGDKQRVEMHVRPGAHLLLTTQTATRVHTMDSGFALQDTHLRVDDGGILEYLPDPVITSAHSRYIQRTLVDVSPGAIAIVGDAFSAGRIAMGERHEADVVFLRSQLRAVAGSSGADAALTAAPTPKSTATATATASIGTEPKPIFNEQALYRGKSALTSPINHGSYTAWANLWVVAPNSNSVKQVLAEWQNYPAIGKRGNAADVTDRNNIADNRAAGVLIGASTFSGNNGCWARLMGNSMEQVLRTQHEYWARARRIILDLDAFDLRKM